MEVIVFAGLAIAVALIIQAVSGAAKRWQEALAYVAQHVGLDFDPGGMLKTSKASGVVDGGFVTVDSFTSGSGEHSTTYTRVVLEGTELPHDLILEKEGVGAGFKKFFVGKDVDVGDARFDELIVARGRPEMLTALLDTATREDVMVAIGRQDITVRDGKIKFTTTGLVREPERLLALTQQVITLARALSPQGRSAAERLYATATADPQSQVRQKAAWHLWNSHSGSNEARRLEAAALDSVDPWMRLAGARRVAQTPRGLEVLVALARDGGNASALRTEAVDALPGQRGREFDDHAVTAVLTQMLPWTSGSLLVATLAALERYDVVAPLDALDRRAYSVGAAARVAIAISARRHGVQAVPLLLYLLAAEDQTEVQIAAARALGTCADLSAVEPLLPHTKGIFTNSQLKEAARAAVDAIQSRAGRGESGGLSMVVESRSKARTGALSRPAAAGEAGQLSQLAPYKEAVTEDAPA